MTWQLPRPIRSFHRRLPTNRSATENLLPLYRCGVGDAAARGACSGCLTVEEPALSLTCFGEGRYDIDSILMRFNTAGSKLAVDGAQFGSTSQTEATLQLRNLNVQPYLAYWPNNPPFRLQGAVVQADLKLGFEQDHVPAMTISGSITAEEVRLLEAWPPDRPPGAGPELLAFKLLPANPSVVAKSMAASARSESATGQNGPD